MRNIDRNSHAIYGMVKLPNPMTFSDS